jgi:hypothetical protein
MFPQSLNERCSALAVPDIVRILLNHNDLVRLQLMAPNSVRPDKIGPLQFDPD